MGVYVVPRVPPGFAFPLSKWQARRHSSMARYSIGRRTVLPAGNVWKMRFLEQGIDLVPTLIPWAQLFLRYIT